MENDEEGKRWMKRCLYVGSIAWMMGKMKSGWIYVDSEEWGRWKRRKR